MSQDDLMQAYARLRALRDNLPGPPTPVIAQRYVDDFHEVHGLLQKYCTVDLKGFKVPSAALTERWPDEGSFYDLAFVKSKIDGLLGFFELRWADPRPSIGFRPQ